MISFINSLLQVLNVQDTYGYKYIQLQKYYEYVGDWNTNIILNLTDFKD